MSTQTLWLIVGSAACAVLLIGVLTLWVIAMLSYRQERADTPPTPEPVPQRSGSPFAPKWLTERKARNEAILKEREARRG